MPAFRGYLNKDILPKLSIKSSVSCYPLEGFFVSMPTLSRYYLIYSGKSIQIESKVLPRATLILLFRGNFVTRLTVGY